MRRRRIERAAVAVVLAAVGASLAFLAIPAGAATDSISATVKYGCRDSGWVEVTLNANGASGSGTYQVGLTSDGSHGPDSQYDAGGPGMVVTSGDPTTIRLAGPVESGDQVFIRQFTGGSAVLPLPQRCSDDQTNFGLQQPTMSKALTASCRTTSSASLQFDLNNPNNLTKAAQDAGLSEIDYTVLVARADDGTLVSTVGDLITYDGKGEQTIGVDMPAAQATNYQVRIIGVDGKVKTQALTTPACASQTGPPPTKTPTPPGPKPPVSKPPVSKPPVSSKPPHPPAPPKSSGSSSTTHTTTTHTSTPSNVGTAGSATTGVGTGANLQPGSSTTNQGIGAPPLNTSGSTPHRSSSPSASPSPQLPVPAPSPNPTQRLLADLPLGGGSLLSWQSDAALIVVVDALLIGGLVGATVWRTRQR